MASTSADVWLFPACDEGGENVPVEPITGTSTHAAAAARLPHCDGPCERTLGNALVLTALCACVLCPTAPAPIHIEFSAAGHGFHEHWRSRVRIRSASHARLVAPATAVPSTV